MRVLTVTNWYPPHHFGGYELSCYDVMVRLEERGHDVHVLCGDTRLPGDPEAPDVDHESRVSRSLRLYHDGSAILRPPVGQRLAIERHNQRALACAIRDVQPDVISVWHLAGASHGLLNAIASTGIPVVFAVCDDWLVYGLRLDAWAEPFHRSPFHRAVGHLIQRVFGVPCVVADIGELGPFLFVTGATEDAALVGSRWWPARRDVVWSGIDRDVYPAADPSSPRPWRWNLVTTGRFDPRKGFETAIRALPLLPSEATLSLWGRGGEAEQNRLQELAEHLGVHDRVRFGSLERHELPAVYAAADAMIFPSEWAEPFGLVPVEAMACNTPVVATRVGGSAEFLHAEVNCLAFPPGDSVALAQALRRLSSDEALRERLVAAGRETAELLDVERLADIMEAWHLHEAHNRSAPPPARRPGVPETSRARCFLRLVSDRQVVVETVKGQTGGVLVNPSALPLADGQLDSACWQTDCVAVDGEHETGVDISEVAAELARVVRPAGTLVIEGANKRDLRLWRDNLVVAWKGWHRRAAPPGGSIKISEVAAVLGQHGTVVRSDSSTWDATIAGRVAAAGLRVARVADRGPRIRVEARRR